MSLEDRFSISKSGGIYYKGTKVTPTKDPILVIGLGGTGIDAMLRVKNEVQSRMEPEVDVNGRILNPVPGNMAFIAVDTDKTTLKKTVGVASIREESNEFLDLRVNGLKQVIQTIVSAHLQDPEWDWYDPELSAEGGADGAGGIRQVGRLMLFHNFQRIRSQLNSIIRTIVAKAQTNNENAKLMVFILTGIGGGTGSGTFLDMAYLLRQLGNDVATNVQLHGYVFTPDLNKTNGGDESAMYRNGFAALKELDYWMSTTDHGQHFRQHYPGNFVIDAVDRPLDFCHIITAKDDENHILDYGQAMDEVAGTLFAYLANEAAVNAKGNTGLTQMYDNISDHISLATANAKYPANYKYQSVGSSAIEIPYREIMTLLAARMFEKLNPVFRLAPNNQTIQQDLNYLHLTYNHLWGDINYNIGADPLANNKQFTYSEIGSNAPYHKVHQWLNGYAHQELASNGHNLQANKERLFADYMKSLIRDSQRGPGYAARLVYSNEGPNLINTMEAYRKDSLQRAGTAASRNVMLESQVQQAYAMVSKSNLFNRGSAVKDYNEALKAWKENDYALWAYTELADGLLTLIERLKKYREKIFHPLLSAISVLPGIFAKNVEVITDSDQAIQKKPQERIRYLILATEFERKHYERVQKDALTAANKFLQDLGENLKKWVGIELNEIDNNVLEASDIPAFVSDLVNESFKEVVSTNLSVERLLLERAPVGTNEDDYIRTVVQNLKTAAVPMFHKDVAAGIVVNPEKFALVSIPDNCTKLSNKDADWGFAINETPRVTAERSKIQWVSVMAGMPLFVFPEVTEMEKRYAIAVANEATRMGVHLRHEWREIMPSPLPESSWPQALRNEPQKKYDREKNAKIRAAYQLCRKEGIIRKASDVNPNDATRDRLLFVADESKLKNLALFGSVTQKRQTLQNLRRAMWGDANTAVKLKAFGSVNQDEDANVCENNLRFFNISQQILHQAEVFGQFRTLTDQFDHVERYINANFAELIKDHGFDRLLFRSMNDYQPIKIGDKMSRNPYPHYDEFQAFSAALKTDGGLADNIDAQFEAARKNLISINGEFIADQVAAKRAILTNLKQQLSQEKDYLEQQIRATPLEQRGDLVKSFDFYTLAVETTEDLLRFFGN